MNTVKVTLVACVQIAAIYAAGALGAMGGFYGAEALHKLITKKKEEKNVQNCSCVGC